MRLFQLLLILIAFLPLDFAEAQHLRRARNIRVGVSSGIYYGTGWLPYWGVNYGWPVYNFPVYGYTYYPYWNYVPRYATYGAIAYSPEARTSGVAWSYSTQQEAFNASYQYCGQADCKTVVWVQGGCAAIAESAENKGITYGYHAYKYSAQSKAIQACRSFGAKDCKIAAWVCSY